MWHRLWRKQSKQQNRSPPGSPRSKISTQLGLLEKLFGLSAVLSHTGWGLLKIDLDSEQFLHSFLENVLRHPLDHNEKQHSESKDDDLYMKTFSIRFTVTQSIEAIVHLNHHSSTETREIPSHESMGDGSEDDLEGKETEGDIYGEGEEGEALDKTTKRGASAASSSIAPTCVILSGKIDGYVKKCLCDFHTQKAQQQQQQQERAPSSPSDGGASSSSSSSSSSSPRRSFGDDLITLEVSCKAQGHDRCEFITAHVERIAEMAKARLAQMGRPDLFSCLVPSIKMLKARHQKGRAWLAGCLLESNPPSPLL